MKNKQTKCLSLSLSLSANPISLNRGTFFAATKVFTEFFDKISKLIPRPLREKVALLRLVSGNNKLTGGTKPALLAHVILGLVPKIFWQRVVNQVNKFALLLHKYRFTQDSRDKPENDWCWRRWFSVCCKSFEHPSPEANASTSPSGGEVTGLLRYTRNDDRTRGEVGKSMIEMLGVLAIIAVLSVGGIAGYSKAMEMWKINKLIEEYGYVVQQLIEKGDSLRVPVKDNNEVFYDAETISAMGFVPNTWKKNGRVFSNSLGHSVVFSSKINLLSMNTELTIISQTKGNTANRVCKELMSKVYKPMHQTIKWISYFGGTAGKVKNFQVDGDYICSRDRECLKNLTVSDIKRICETCAPKKDIYRCNMIVFF